MPYWIYPHNSINVCEILFIEIFIKSHQCMCTFGQIQVISNYNNDNNIEHGDDINEDGSW